MSNGRCLKMLPVLPKPSRRSGAIEAMRDIGLKRVATVATPFINLNKKKGFRKNFLKSCGNSGNKVNLVYIGERLIKKSGCLDPLTASVINKVNLVKGVTHALTQHIQA